jgi:hypothetical protein
MSERRALWASTAAPSSEHDYLLAAQRTPLWTDWNMRHIATHCVGSTATKTAVFARAVVVFAIQLIRSRPDLVHLHAVGKFGSVSRSAILARMSRLARVPVILHVHNGEKSRWPRTLQVIEPGARIVTVQIPVDGLDALYREVSHQYE